MNVKALNALHSEYKKICVVTQELKSSKSSGKALKRKLKFHMENYVSMITDALNNGGLDADPFGVLNKNGLVGSLAHNILDECIAEHNKQSSEEVSQLDKLCIKQVIQTAKAKVSGVFAGGVTYLFDPSTGKLTFAYGKCKKTVELAVDKLRNAALTVKEFFQELWASMFPKNPEVIPAS